MNTFTTRQRSRGGSTRTDEDNASICVHQVRKVQKQNKKPCKGTGEY